MPAVISGEGGLERVIAWLVIRECRIDYRYKRVLSNRFLKETSMRHLHENDRLELGEVPGPVTPGVPLPRAVSG